MEVCIDSPEEALVGLYKLQDVLKLSQTSTNHYRYCTNISFVWFLKTATTTTNCLWLPHPDDFLSERGAMSFLMDLNFTCGDLFQSVTTKVLCGKPQSKQILLLRMEWKSWDALSTYASIFMLVFAFSPPGVGDNYASSFQITLISIPLTRCLSVSKTLPIRTSVFYLCKQNIFLKLSEFSNEKEKFLNGQKNWTDTSPKMYQWPMSTRKDAQL